MRMEVSSIQGTVLTDSHSPYGSLVFEKDVINSHITIYQDSEDEEVGTVFGGLDENAYFSQVKLIEGLQKIISLLKEGG